MINNNVDAERRANCSVPENIHTPTEGNGNCDERGVGQKEAIFGEVGGGGFLIASNFRGLLVRLVS